jgi:hypothetical protein
MNKMMIGAVMAAFAVPALAMQQEAATKQAPNPGALPHTVHGELTLFQMQGFNGDEFVVRELGSTVHTDWPIRSVLVHPGDRWQICARPRFHDPCIILDRSVRDASAIGVDDQIGSARLAPEQAQQPH